MGHVNLERAREVGQLFDVVLLRQGLCFCDDPSKTSTAWPQLGVLRFRSLLPACVTHGLGWK